MAIKTPPMKVVYKKGEKLNLDGISLSAVDVDGNRRIFTKGIKVTGFNSNKAGKQKLTVSFGNMTDTFTVTVK